MKHLSVRVLLAVIVGIVVLGASARSSGSEDVQAWLLSATRSWQPYFAIPEMRDAGKIVSPAESLDEHGKRRAEIISAVWRAASDEKTPILFTGPNGRAFTALFVLAIWKEESHYDLRVDKFHCAGLPKGSCDGGHAYCLGQVHPKDVPQLGYTGPELEADNFKCALATIHRLAAAKAGTPKEAHPADRFCGYAIGRFESPCPPMRFRYQYASTWAANKPLP